MKLKKLGDWHIPKHEGLNSNIGIIEWTKKIEFSHIEPDASLISMGFKEYFYKSKIVKNVDGYADGVLEIKFHFSEYELDLITLYLNFSYSDIDEYRRLPVEVHTTLKLAIGKDGWGNLVIRNDKISTFDYVP